MRYFITFINHELQCAHWDVLQGLNKLKNYRLRWLSKPLRLAKFESLESKYVLQWLFLGYWTIFLFLLLLSLSFLTEFSQRFCSDSFFLNPPSTVGCFPFYSVILGFQCITDSPPLFPWVPEPMSCQPLWCHRVWWIGLPTTWNRFVAATTFLNS